MYKERVSRLQSSWASRETFILLLLLLLCSACTRSFVGGLPESRSSGDIHGVVKSGIATAWLVSSYSDVLPARSAARCTSLDGESGTTLVRQSETLMVRVTTQCNGLVQEEQVERLFVRAFDQIQVARRWVNWPGVATIEIDIVGDAGLKKRTVFLRRSASPRVSLTFSPPDGADDQASEAWVARVVAVSIHELAHVENRNRRLDLLNDEVYAYMLQKCSDYILSGALDYVPYDFRPDRDFWAELSVGEITWQAAVAQTESLRESTAASVLVESSWRWLADQGKMTVASMSSVCARYFASPTDIRTVPAGAGLPP